MGTAGDGLAGLLALQSRPFDAAAVDVALPGTDGVELRRHVRREGLPVAIVLVAARDGLHDRILGLDSDAHDSRVKPFALEEFAARIRALSRRAAGAGGRLVESGWSRPTTFITVQLVSGRFSVVPAAHVYLLRDREVLLQRRQHTGYMDGHWVAAAAGHIEAGETAAVAAVREVREELGVHVLPGDLTPVTLLQRTDGSDDPVQQRADWYFTTRRWIGTPRILEPEKCDALAWYSLDAFPAPVPGYEAVVLDGLRRGGLTPFSSFGFDSVQLTTASPGDAVAMRGLARAAYAPWVEWIGREPAPTLADYDAVARSGRAVLLRRDGHLVGLLVTDLDEDALVVENVAVLPEAQGTGLGQVLLQEADRIARATGKREIRLYTNVAMRANIAYYIARGFIETHRATVDGYCRVYFTKVVEG